MMAKQVNFLLLFCSINLLQWIEVMGISTHSDSEQLYVTNHSECDTTGFGSRVVNVADFRRQA